MMPRPLKRMYVHFASMETIENIIGNSTLLRRNIIKYVKFGITALTKTFVRALRVLEPPPPPENKKNKKQKHIAIQQLLCV